MRLPSSLDSIRQTHLWQKLKDWRYLHRHRALREFYAQFVRPGSLVFDLGANVGHYALIFRSLGSRVVAVEPQAELVAGLRWRFSGRKDMQIVQAAVGATRATAVLHKAPNQSEIASLRADVGERSRFATSHHFSEVETVPVVTLDSLLQQFGRPDFCKIDVEGFECEVLAGLSQPLPLLSLEFNREFWTETKRCLGRLAELGDYRFNYTLGEISALAGSGWIDATALISELEASKDPLLWGDLYARPA
ncbi:MAG TPA: FkbM family methyltransferase [Opitutaceae bacterium]|jgi:FkbM family methyltransferase|nr:FkbM family methyltransferase [Opitutaceae bacterium]